MLLEEDRAVLDEHVFEGGEASADAVLLEEVVVELTNENRRQKAWGARNDGG